MSPRPLVELWAMAWSFGFKSRREPTRVKFPRAHERLLPQGMSCQLGLVLDVSAGGMRVRCAESPKFDRGAFVHFAIRGQRQQMTLRGQIVWIRRTAWKQFEVGVRWAELPDAHCRILLELARYGFVEVATTPSWSTTGASGSSPGGAKAPDAGTAGSSHAGAKPQEPPEHVEDLYRILGVERNATSEQIATAYRAMARLLHPDVARHEGADKHFAAVSKAYSVLRETEARKKYDALLFRSSQSARSA